MALFTRPRFQQAVKALTLLGLALFLYTRLADGTLFFTSINVFWPTQSLPLLRRC